MKSIIEFNLDEADDQYNLKQCLKGKDMALMLWDFQEYLRVQLKHGQLSPERYEQTEKIRDMFIVGLDAHGIDLDDLIY